MKKTNRNSKPATKNNSVKTALIVAAILLLGWLVLKPTGSAKIAPSTVTSAPTVRTILTPTFKFETKGVGLSVEEVGMFGAKSPNTLKLFRAMAESGHPYMVEAVKKAKAMEIAFAVQQPPADLGGQMEAEAQFTAQMFSDGKMRPVIYVRPALLTSDVPDALVQRKVVHEYHHFKQWEKGKFENQEASGAQAVISLLKTEIPAWIVECEYSVYGLKFLKDETDVCQGISRGGRKALAWAIAENYVEKYQNGRFRQFKTDVIAYLNSTEF